MLEQLHAGKLTNAFQNPFPYKDFPPFLIYHPHKHTCSQSAGPSHNMAGWKPPVVDPVASALYSRVVLVGSAHEKVPINVTSPYSMCTISHSNLYITSTTHNPTPITTYHRQVYIQPNLHFTFPHSTTRECILQKGCLLRR